jgi:RNA polymerase sigma-54 factor
MEIRQRLELRKLLVSELSQSLNILALPYLEIKGLVENELESNPLLEESLPPSYSKTRVQGPDLDFRLTQITQKVTLQDMLLRQLGMFTDTDEEFKIGEEIIGNIDGNGYLKASLEEIAAKLNIAPVNVEKILKLIQQFEPAGVGARTVPECLRIQLELANEKNPLLLKIVDCHLDDVAKKNYGLIAKTLKEPQENIEPLIKKILKLDPKPGRNYTQEEIQHIIPDITVDLKDEDLEITINNEDIPNLDINKTYKEMLQEHGLDPKTKEFLTEKLRNATELLRAISRRQTTLRRIVEVVLVIQQDAIRENLSHLKPLTFARVAKEINMHESTVCRAIMNKYVKTPFGVVALKDFFPSSIHDQNGQVVSSSHAKRVIKELIDQEDKKHPLSDQEIAEILAKDKNLNISRRTVAKYREELKVLSSAFRKER